MSMYHGGQAGLYVVTVVGYPSVLEVGMRPESVEIKVTLAGTNVGEAVAALGLPEGRRWRIVFCEDVTTGVAPLTPLLDIGVVLRARKKSGTKGDSTVKLRPCPLVATERGLFCQP
jgi:hypothetical protein